MFSKPSDYLEVGLNLSLGEDFKYLLNSKAIIKRIPKGTIVVKQGEIAFSLYYIYKGIMRGYYIDNSGNDMTKCFASEMEFACGEGLLKAGEASFSVESLEDSICVVIPYSFIVEGLKKDDEIKDMLVDKYILKVLAKIEKRERELLMKSALDRYIGFKRDYAFIEDRISEANIASYIGIRASSLSRIKRSMKNNK